MIYELVIKYLLYDQECNNRFHYTSPAVGNLAGGSEDLTEGFLISPLMINLLEFWTNTNPVDLHTVTTRALYDDTDFFEKEAVGLAGLGAGGQAVASSSALGFRTARFQTGRNRGYKRFSGYGETDVDGNTFGSTGDADAVAASLDNLITGDTLGELYGPRVLLMDRADAPDYHLFDTEAAQRLNMSPFGLVWTANVNTTTQRSRLPGHGD